MTRPRIAVVLSAEVIVAAAVRINPDLIFFEPVPPPKGIEELDVLGSFARDDFSDFRLILTDDIITQSLTAVVATHEFDFSHRDQLGDELVRLMHISGGGRVSPNRGVQLPKNLNDMSVAALRCATSEDFGARRTVVVVTSDENAIALREWTPRGVPWNKDSFVKVLSLRGYNDLVEEVRRTKRQSL